MYCTGGFSIVPPGMRQSLGNEDREEALYPLCDKKGSKGRL